MNMAWKTTLVLLAAGWMGAGCGDQSGSSGAAGSGASAERPAETVTSAVENAAKAAADSTKAASQEVSKAVEAAKPHLQEAAKAVQAAVSDAGAAAQATFTNTVAEVRKLLSEGKATEAVQKVQAALADFKLTPEQQKTIDDLKKQAQEALSKDGLEAAKKAVGDLLKPKQP